MSKPISASVIVPSLGRGESLEKCLRSLHGQTFKEFEIIVETEEGPLAKIRNNGARRSRGEYLVFIDDDVECESGWLQAIVHSFGQSPSIGGVSGPAFIHPTYRSDRDLFRYAFLKWIYDRYFCEGRHALPGHITKAGAWTTGASEKNCNYVGAVDFLEACNMAWRADKFWEVGGFDEEYKGVGDWSEPDLAYRIKEVGGALWFNPKARLRHNPSKSGAYKKRGKDSHNRMANYELFSKRWIKPCLKHSLYKLFMRSYYAFKAVKRHNHN